MNMKRIFSIAAIAIVSGLMLTACAEPPPGNGGVADKVEESTVVDESNAGNAVGESTGNVVEEINANSNLPMALLMPYEDVSDTLKQDGSLDFINNFMSADYHADGYMLSFAGFPEDDSPYCLTTIELTDDNYDICGVKAGDNMTQAAQTLQGLGFTTEDDANEFVKDGVIISLSSDGNELVEAISIEVPSKYTSGNLY